MALWDITSKEMFEGLNMILDKMIKEEEEKENKRRKDLKRKIEKNIQVPVKDKKRKM